MSKTIAWHISSTNAWFVLQALILFYPTQLAYPAKVAFYAMGRQVVNIRLTIPFSEVKSAQQAITAQQGRLWLHLVLGVLITLLSKDPLQLNASNAPRTRSEFQQVRQAVSLVELMGLQ
jgi:hypothetical protein